MRREMYERILTFGEYFSHMIESVKKRFGQYMGMLGISVGLIFGWSMIFGLLVVLIVGLSLPGIFQDPTMAYGMTNQQMAAFVMKFLPMLFLVYVFALAGALYISNVSVAMCYLITDSYVADTKRPFGEMLKYAFRRALPMLGTEFLYFLLMGGIWMVFSTVVALLFGVMFIANATQLQTFDDASVLLGMWQIWVALVLWIAMLVFTIYLMIRYSFSILGRAKYKFSAYQSMKYSRILTRGKVAKIFGNLLLIALLTGLPIVLITLGTGHVLDASAITGLALLTMLLSIFLSLFTSTFQSVLFINFDAVRGSSVISMLDKPVHNLKDSSFYDDTGVQGPFAPNSGGGAVMQAAPVATTAAFAGEQEKTDEHVVAPDEQMKKDNMVQEAELTVKEDILHQTEVKTDSDLEE